MTKEGKDLLLRDLSSRISHGVIVSCCDIVGEKVTSIDENGLVNNDYDIDEVKPFLFPLSSMTEEQQKEFDKVIEINLKVLSGDIDRLEATAFEIDFYHRNHLDWRGLIPKGLAIDATGRNIYGEEEI